MMRKMCAIAGGSTAVLLGLLCVVVPGMAAAQQRGGAQQISASAPGAVIPLAEVATQATEVAQLLRTLRAQVVHNPAIDTIHRGLPEVRRTIDLAPTATSTMLASQEQLAGNVRLGSQE